MSKGEKTRMNVTLSSCFVLPSFRILNPPSFRICNPKVSLIRILNPNNKALGLQTPKDEGRGDPPSFWIYNPKVSLIRILKS